MRALDAFIRSMRPPRLAALIVSASRKRSGMPAAWAWGSIILIALLAPVAARANSSTFACPVKFGANSFQCKSEQSSCGTSWVCATLNVTPSTPKGGCVCWPIFPKSSSDYSTTGGWFSTGSTSSFAANTTTRLTLAPITGNVLTFIDQVTASSDPNMSPMESLNGTNDLTGYIVVSLGNTTLLPDSIPARITGMYLQFPSFIFRGSPSGPNVIQLAQGGSSVFGVYSPSTGTVSFNNAVPCVWSNSRFTSLYYAHPDFTTQGPNQFGFLPAGVTAFETAPAPAQETISASAASGGTITPSGTVIVADGANQTFTIAPDNCHTIAGVTVDGVGRGSVATYTFLNVTTNHAISATFTALGPYSISTSAGAGAAITPSGAVSVACGASQTFTMTPASCHAIQQVTVDGTAMGSLTSYTFSNVHGSHSISVTSSLLGPFSIYATAGAGGSISPSGTTSVPCGGGTQYDIVPIDTRCYDRNDVVVDGVSFGPISSYTFSNVTSNHTISASFTALGPFTITASSDAGGVITPSGTLSISCGGSQTYSWAANSCHTIQSVTVDGNGVSTTSPYMFTGVTGSHTIQVTTSPLGPYPITSSADAGITISPSGTLSIACGGSQTYTWSSGSCTAVSNVTVDGTSFGVLSSYTFDLVQAAHSIHVSASPLGPFTIHTTAGANGSISPSGDVAVPCGQDQDFTFTADPGYVVQDVEVDGTSAGAILSYTFTDVIEDHALTCTYKIPLVAPPYEPAKWNDGPGDPPDPNHAQDDNNCYNYAVNQQTNSFAQPGTGSGHPPATFDCAGIKAAAIADGLVATDKNSVCDNGYKVALVFGDVQTPEGKAKDYHWYRQDSNGTWSHKPGQTEATNKDASHNDITDPETADKGKNNDNTAQYAEFCGYFCVTKTTAVHLVEGAPGLPAPQELQALLGAPRTAVRTGPTLLSNQILAHPIAASGLPDPTRVLTSQADLDSITARLTGLPTTGDPQWPSRLGYRGFRLVLDDVAPVGNARVRVWNGVVEIDQGSSRSFYLDSKQLENWLALRFYGVLITGVSDLGSGVSRLASPAPNPFRVRSSIAFALEHAGRVELRIYDITGRVVRSLIDDRLVAGRHDVVWNGQDEGGTPLRSGTYFYRLSLDGRTIGSRKTVFLGR